jgi:hypothetical protein
LLCKLKSKILFNGVKNMNKKISPRIIALVFSVLIVCFAVSFYVFAWTEPTDDPPAENASAPLNVSSSAQVKVGGLILNTGGAAVGLAVDQGSVGIGTTSPAGGYKLDVEGSIQATAFDTGDITFTNQETNQTLWRMFEDENGLYLENARTGKVYRFVLEELSE